MRVVGLAIHRVFAEAVVLDQGGVTRLGRVGMTRVTIWRRSHGR
jgi:transposase